MVTKFVAHFFSSPAIHGCGATALGLLTGVNPCRIEPRKDWDERFMVKFLRDKKFEVAKLTPEKITGKEITRPLNSTHVILASLRFVRKEASWVVIHNGTLYHNFEISKLRPYELLNHRLINCFLVKHPSWD